MDDEYESVLFIANESYVYKIPPRSSSRGYKAAEWGDMEAFLWKGRCRIIAKGDKAFIRLEDANSGDVFAVCNYDGTSATVEPVLDSSRYFVLRVEDGGRKAYIGMGFQERTEAFDFNVALQDHVKHVKAEKEAATAANAPAEASAPAKDWSLKAGETISINIGGKEGGSRRKPAPSGGAIPMLAPPPSAASVRKQTQGGGLVGLPSAK